MFVDLTALLPLASIALLAFTSVANADDTSDIDMIHQRRKVDSAAFVGTQYIPLISHYLEIQTDEGIWPDVIYTAGCNAQTANWPIQQHWIRVISMAAAWSGLNPDISANYTGSEELLAAAKKGMDWWFARDFSELACMGAGGDKDSACTCHTPGLWNPNWYDQVILIPQLTTTACLLVYDTNLTDAQKKGCYDIPARAYDISSGNIEGIQKLTGSPTLTGSNAINVAQNSISLALYTGNKTMFEESVAKVFSLIVFSDGQKQDGIHRDGSFLLHSGITYNANYGKDVINIFIQVAGEVTGTAYAAPRNAVEAMSALIQGSEWMIFVDERNRQEHWDFNTVGRFVGFPTYEPQGQAVADINFNTTNLGVATADFPADLSVNDTIRRLLSNGTEKLVGNRAFYASDYMIHRRDDVIVTNKMISNRSINSEYVVGANPYGFHLGQGTLYLYKDGSEYIDIQAAWDWNLIPGRTCLLNYPKLKSSIVTFTGKKNYVGTVSDGWVGTSVEDYVDPNDGSLSYQKAWFFLDDSILVTTTQIGRNASAVNATGIPVISVLDNRRATDGGVWVDGAVFDASQNATVNATTLYYGETGYVSYDTPFSLVLSEMNRTGNWSQLSTSISGVETVPIFSAYTVFPDRPTYSYLVIPVATPDRLASEASAPTTTALDMDGVLGAAGAERLSLVFWPSRSNTATVAMSTIGWATEGEFSVTSSKPAIYLFATKTNSDGSKTMVITLSEPTQLLDSLTVQISTSGYSGKLSCVDGYKCVMSGDRLTFDVALPSGGLAGSSTFLEVKLA